MLGGGAGRSNLIEAAQSVLTGMVLVGSAVFGIKPSCSHLRHVDSKSAWAGDATAVADGVTAGVAPVLGDGLAVAGGF